VYKKEDVVRQKGGCHYKYMDAPTLRGYKKEDVIIPKRRALDNHLVSLEVFQRLEHYSGRRVLYNLFGSFCAKPADF